MSEKLKSLLLKGTKSQIVLFSILGILFGLGGVFLFFIMPILNMLYMKGSGKEIGNRSLLYIMLGLLSIVGSVFFGLLAAKNKEIFVKE